jgi:hypothetical protein
VGSPLQEILATAAEEDMTAIATASHGWGPFGSGQSVASPARFYGKVGIRCCFSRAVP